MPVSGQAYRLSPRAETDLEDIWLYTVRHWSLEQANRYQRQIVGVIEELAVGKKIGRSADIRTGYFKYPVGSHVVFYRHSDGSLDVIRILHQRMDAASNL